MTQPRRAGLLAKAHARPPPALATSPAGEGLEVARSWLNEPQVWRRNRCWERDSWKNGDGEMASEEASMGWVNEAVETAKPILV